MKDFYEYQNWNASEEDGELPEQPKHFDVIILDLNMPIMDGYEACRQIIQIYD